MGDEIHAPAPGEAAISADADRAVKVDRRRPGRVQYTNPTLIALLRRPKSSDVPASVLADADADADDIARVDVPGPEWEQEDDSDDFAPSRGIMLGLLISAPFWAAIAALCWWWFGR